MFSLRRIFKLKRGPETQDELTNPLLSVFYVLKFLGRFPFTVNKLDGRLTFRLVSATTLWTAVMMCLQVAMTTMIYFWKLTHINRWASFDTIINNISEIVVLQFTFHFTFSWWDTSALLRAYNRWTSFHIRFSAECHKPITSIWLRYSHLGTIFIIINSLLIIWIHESAEERCNYGKLFKIIMYTTCVSYNCIVVLMWALYCLMIRTTSKIFNEHFLEVLSRDHTPGELTSLRLLWLEFQACTLDWTAGFSSIMFAWAGLQIWITVLNAYAFFTVIIFYHSFDVGNTPFPLVTTILTFYIIYTSTHYTNTSLEIFLDAVEMGRPCLELRAIFTLDRSQLMSVLQAYLTYIIVLLQFREST